MTHYCLGIGSNSYSYDDGFAAVATDVLLDIYGVQDHGRRIGGALKLTKTKLIILLVVHSKAPYSASPRPHPS